ncbi:hypothetical protein PAHAL_J038500 [Panicum hallii]|uniref:Jacalin-type lectin domain-containing protein n=1 Tax=Panicum hallii TaxID=206008 RepID=A0A2T7A9T8_9POAL|nr:protein GOS9-like [Panicum hallii]PUV26721.1 hypothetical protein PAHAL_J038500 [Panicum hallii]
MAMIAVGPFGGAQGTSHDMTGTSKKLQSVTVYSSKDGAGGHINGISFSYENDQGSTTSVDTWGTAAGSKATFTFPAGAYLANLSGTFDNNVKSLTFVTSDGEPYGPYGDPAAGKGFEIPLHKGAIVGFFAHSGGVLNSLGAYVGAQP